MQSYNYAHREGILEISWERFGQLAGQLAEKLGHKGIQVVVGIARAGLFPATAVACSLRCEYYPVRVTRRVNDQIIHDRPIWKVDVSPGVKGHRVAVIDEIADTGETLALVAKRAYERGATEVITACLVSHTWANPAPDNVVLESDALVLFPWDRHIYKQGRWQLHPELEKALRLQGIDPQEFGDV